MGGPSDNFSIDKSWVYRRATNFCFRGLAHTNMLEQKEKKEKEEEEEGKEEEEKQHKKRRKRIKVKSVGKISKRASSDYIRTPYKREFQKEGETVRTARRKSFLLLSISFFLSLARFWLAIREE